MISGKKVGLRALEKEDLSILKDWRNIPSFRKNFREVRELNLYRQEKWFEKTTNSPDDFMFIITDLDTNEPIGACGLLYTNWIIRSADFSFYIGKNNWYIDNKGYAQEAAELLISYAFNNLNLNKVWMELYEFDKSKILFFTKKLFFKKDGLLRQNCFENGKYHNSLVISLLKGEFKS